MSKESAGSKVADWQPQQRNEDGVHLTGAAGLPANHRQRAEALVGMRRRSDPDGIVSDELIANTAARLKAEAASTAAAPEVERKAGEGAGAAAGSGSDQS